MGGRSVAAIVRGSTAGAWEAQIRRFGHHCLQGRPRVAVLAEWRTQLKNAVFYRVSRPQADFANSARWRTRLTSGGCNSAHLFTKDRCRSHMANNLATGHVTLSRLLN